MLDNFTTYRVLLPHKKTLVSQLVLYYNVSNLGNNKVQEEPCGWEMNLEDINWPWARERSHDIISMKNKKRYLAEFQKNVTLHCE